MKNMMKEYLSKELSEEKNEPRNSVGKAMRSATITDAMMRGKPSRTNPMGYMSMQCFSGSPDQRKSPTSKPGNAGGKDII
jgi:hypothetical protein